MPGKRSQPSLIEVVMASRWPVATAVAVIWFVVGILVLPTVLAESVVLAGLIPLVRTVASLGVFAFGAIAIAKYLQETNAERTAARATARLRVVERARERARTAERSRTAERARTVERAQTAEPTRTRNAGASGDPAGPPRVEPFVREEPLVREEAFANAKPSVQTEPSIRAAASAPAAPTEWSLALLQSIEWKRFEEVVAAYFRAKNFRCKTVEYGPDGGVDGRLYFGDQFEPAGVVQCKAWGDRPVGVAPVRELLGVMAHEKVKRGYFCATGEFTKEATAFAASNPIKLIPGRDLLEAIAAMPAEDQRKLLAVSTTGDYTTPTCPSCGVKLVERTIGGRAAWGCRNFPRCRVKIFRKGDRSGG